MDDISIYFSCLYIDASGSNDIAADLSVLPISFSLLFITRSDILSNCFLEIFNWSLLLKSSYESKSSLTLSFSQSFNSKYFLLNIDSAKSFGVFTPNSLFSNGLVLKQASSKQCCKRSPLAISFKSFLLSSILFFISLVALLYASTSSSVELSLGFSIALSLATSSTISFVIPSISSEMDVFNFMSTIS